MFNLGYGEDGRAAAADAIKKTLAGKPFRRDTVDNIFKSAGAAGKSDEPSIALVRKLHDAGTKSNIVRPSAETFRKRGADAMAKSIAGALRKVGLPAQSSNASGTIAMPDTGAGNVHTSQFGVNDKVPQAATGARDAADDPTVAALKSIYAKGPTRMFG